LTVTCANKIHPVGCRSKESFAQRTDLWHASEEEILLAAAPREKPTAHGHRLNAVQRARRLDFGVLQSGREFQRASETSLNSPHAVE
jgi:hypothetical protein